ncbi:hypothetical protein F5884DRAFT_857847 [Xylogone sp. PMI_703]|nr:hypothetical protein F5884DRAFT_857847 [Xylogone sp. PMI_703]
MPVAPQPEPLSLRDLIVTHQSKRLWCDPDVWTDELLELLQCTVHSDEDPTVDDDDLTFMFDYNARNLKGPIWQIYECSLSERRRDADISELFHCIVIEVEAKIDSEIIFRYFETIPLYYGGKAVAEVGVRYFIQEKGRENNLCAYIDTSWMTTITGFQNFARRASKHKRKCSMFNPCVGCLVVEYSIDPYFVAVLIAMAQNSPRLAKGETRSGPTIVHLVTPNKARTAFDWYTAAISPAFLSKFDQPYKHFDAPLDVTKQTIPLTYDNICSLISDPTWLGREKTKPPLGNCLRYKGKGKEEHGMDDGLSNIISLIAKVSTPIRHF